MVIRMMMVIKWCFAVSPLKMTRVKTKAKSCKFPIGFMNFVSCLLIYIIVYNQANAAVRNKPFIQDQDQDLVTNGTARILGFTSSEECFYICLFVCLFVNKVTQPLWMNAHEILERFSLRRGTLIGFWRDDLLSYLDPGILFLLRLIVKYCYFANDRQMSALYCQ